MCLSQLGCMGVAIIHIRVAKVSPPMMMMIVMRRFWSTARTIMSPQCMTSKYDHKRLRFWFWTQDCRVIVMMAEALHPTTSKYEQCPREAFDGEVVRDNKFDVDHDNRQVLYNQKWMNMLSLLKKKKLKSSDIRRVKQICLKSPTLEFSRCLQKLWL